MTMHYDNVDNYTDMVYDYSQREDYSTNDYGKNNEKPDDGFSKGNKPGRHSSIEPNKIQQVANYPTGNIRMVV